MNVAVTGSVVPEKNDTLCVDSPGDENVMALARGNLQPAT